MPTYDFKCKECGLVKEATMSFKESEKGIKCDCDGNMVRQFTPTANLQCSWNPPYKPGTDAREDRKRAVVSQINKKKLDKNEVNEHNANFADLL